MVPDGRDTILFLEEATKSPVQTTEIHRVCEFAEHKIKIQKSIIFVYKNNITIKDESHS